MKTKRAVSAENSFARAPLVRELYGLGLSMPEIAMLARRCHLNIGGGWSSATIRMDIMRFGGAKAFPNRPKKRGVFAAALKHYAEIMVLQRDAGVSERDDIPGALLRAALAEWLREDEILAMIRGMERAMEHLVVPQVPSERYGEARLIAAIFGTALAPHESPYANPRLLWECYCAMVLQEHRPVAQTREDLGRLLAQEHIKQWRKDIMPAWDNTVFDVLNRTLTMLTDRERAVLQKRFGFNGAEPETHKEIGKEWMVTRERIRQIEAKAIRKLRHPSRSDALLPFIASCEHTIEAAYRQYTQREFRSALTSRIPVADAIVVSVLLRSVDDLAVSIRTANALSMNRMRFLADLVERTDMEMLRMKGFGRKSLKEIKEELAKADLSLGMTLSTAIKQALDHARVGGIAPASPSMT